MVNRVIRKSFYITLILAGVLIPSGNAFAEDDTTFSITVNPSLNLSVSKAISGFSVTPSKNGTYDSDSFNVISSTNNVTGYTLTMSVDDTDLVSETINVNTGDPLTIPTLTKTQDGITAAQFEASTDSSVLNHYGISIAGANYNALESPKTILETGENNTTADVTAISLAAKLDLLTVPAVYSTTINFQMVANALPEPTPPGVQGGSINEASSHQGMSMGDSSNVSYPANSLLRSLEIAYVQAGKPIYIEDANADIGWRPMTSSDTGGQVRFAIQDISMTFTENDVTHKVCEWAAESTSNFVDEALVMDIRDGKSYWIAKLADGKCWMTQNLDLDLVHTANDADAKYTHANTDLGWATNDSTVKWNPERSIITFDAATATYIQDWSDSYFDPYSADPGILYMVTSGNDNNDTPYYTLANCMSHVSTGTENECRHYHAGNYYNWTAAIAENDSDTDYLNAEYNTAPNSICPAGWRLPIGKSSETYSSSTTEFAQLLYSQGITSSLGGTSFAQDGFTNIRYTPLFFVRAGVVSDWPSYDAYTGEFAHYWSSSIVDGTYAMEFAFSPSWQQQVQPVTVNDRTAGQSVRCVAR